MRGFFILMLFILGGILPSFAQDLDRQAFFAQGLRPQYTDDLKKFPDLPYYTFNLTLRADFNSAILAGTGEILYTNTSPNELTEIVLRVYPNFHTFGGNAVLENIRVDDELIEPSLDQTRTVWGLILDEPLPIGEQVSIRFDYSTTVYYGRGGLYNLYSYLETELAMASTLPLLSVYDPVSGWWRGTAHKQGDAVFSESGNFDVTLTAPSYLKVITSGTQVSEGRNEKDDTVTRRYSAPLMRDFSLMASGRYETISGEFEDILIEVHYLYDKAAAELALQWTIDSFEAYTEAFGDYVYNEFDVVQTLTTAGGIEYPGLVVMGGEYWGSSSPWFERIMVHEVAHQWWYGMVGNNQSQLTWIDEALTDYSVLVYMRHVYGQEAYDSLLAVYERIYTNYEAENGYGVIGLPAASYKDSAFLPLIYRKGGVFFHRLSDFMGQDTFLKALQTYLSTYRYGIVGATDMQTLFEEVAEVELDDRFLRWVGYSN